MSIEPLSWGRGSTAGVLAGPAGVAGGTDLQRWSVPARSADLEAIRTALTDPESLGVVITGARGVGKSSLARTAVAELGPDVWSLQLRSPLSGSQTSYACLAFLMARLPQSALASPTAILQGITSLIRSDAAGRDCIITLDTTGPIDDMSAGVILNIMLTHTARVIAIAPSTSDLPADFHWLLTDRRLTEVRLDNLNELQTRQVLLTLLGHRVSASLVSTYHAIVGGTRCCSRHSSQSSSSQETSSCRIPSGPCVTGWCSTAPPGWMTLSGPAGPGKNRKPARSSRCSRVRGGSRSPG
ncbi:hypothetical protein [Arthrobacter globiformis]|uniref:hypothetical protein n=1 Tax=Arthrobacter globiformis TaxID=1665 RepID=UPI00345EED1D